MTYFASCCCVVPPVPCDCEEEEIESVKIGFAFGTLFNERTARRRCENCFERNEWEALNWVNQTYYEGEFTFHCVGGSTFETANPEADEALFSSVNNTRTSLRSYDVRCPISFCQNPSYFRFYQSGGSGQTADPIFEFPNSPTATTYQMTGFVLRQQPWYESFVPEAAANANVPEPTLDDDTWYRVVQFSLAQDIEGESFFTERRYDCAGYFENDGTTPEIYLPQAAIICIREVGEQCDNTAFGDPFFEIGNPGNDGAIGNIGWMFLNVDNYVTNCHLGSGPDCTINCQPETCSQCANVGASSFNQIPDVILHAVRGGLTSFGVEYVNP